MHVYSKDIIFAHVHASLTRMIRPRAAFIRNDTAAAFSIRYSGIEYRYLLKKGEVLREVPREIPGEIPGKITWEEPDPGRWFT